MTKAKQRNRKNKLRKRLPGRRLTFNLEGLQIPLHHLLLFQKLNTLQHISLFDIECPLLGHLYWGSKLGFLSDERTFLKVLDCSNRDENGDFMVTFSSNEEGVFKQSAREWEFQRLLIGNRGETTC